MMGFARTMTGSKNETSSSSKVPESVAIAKKIATHAKLDPFGSKFLKYLQFASAAIKKSSCAGRCSSPWMELRTLGALESIMEALKHTFVCPQIKYLSDSVKTSNPDLTLDENEMNSVGRVKEICNIALSILSNAFALDYSVRAQAVDSMFINSLQQFISTFTQDGTVTFKNAELVSRAVKCTANLSNDSSCRESVLRTGVAISILKILELADEIVVTKTEATAESEDSFVDKSSNSNLVVASVRCIRILAADSKFTSSGRDHLLKFGGLEAVINVLTWDAKISSNEDLMLDVIRALTLLSIKVRSAPVEVIQKLIYIPEVCKIRCLVRIFENSQSDGKLYTPVINCLINFSSNKEISDCLGGLRIFHVILDKLENSDENHYNDLIKLLIALTRYSSFNNSHLATSSLIGSTLKILKSSRFKEFHNWLLTVYEKLYEGSLSKLIKCGLVDHLCDILREELEECDYDSLRKKISSFDDGKCSVHQLQEDGVCPFAPVYRCSSPSYQKIQEDMKFMGPISEDNLVEYSHSRGDDSLSPFSSPAHSWSSGGSSPCYSGVSHASYSSFSEDEGCYSPTPTAQKRLRSKSPVLEPTEKMEVDKSLSDADGDSDEHGPVLKRLKLEDGSSSSTLSDSSSIKKQPCDKSLEVLKASGKKIVSVLNILYKCTHITPFPGAMLQITSILLGILVRGKVSLMTQRLEHSKVQSDEELHDLSRRSFEVSYKIILKMCSIYQIFPEMMVSGIVPVLHRLQEPVVSCQNLKLDEQIGIVQEYCTNLITRMVGLENDTAGWREGFIMRTLLVNNDSISSDKMNQTILNIPLLYEKHPITLRKFEMKAKSWTKILEMLVNSDETSFYRFEDCALALCSICSALGVKWKAHDADSPKLFNIPVDKRDSNVLKIIASDEANILSEQDELTVLLTLDDGNSLLVKKELLVNASPVFSAMFNGHFVEAGEQKVHLPNVSITAACLLINQIYMLTEPDYSSDSSKCENQYELVTIFELFSLADRFLLDEIYERALNTLITKYICPYSAPIIYAESVKLVNVQRSDNSRQMLGDAGLNLFILKYILTGEGIRMAERCTAIRKVFDTVVPEYVVRDLKTLIEHYMYKPV